MRPNQKHNYAKIVKDFKSNEFYTSIKHFILDSRLMTESQYNSGQTQRKLKEFGGIKMIEQVKKMKIAKANIIDTDKLLKNPLKYAPKEIVLSNANQLKDEAKIAKNNVLTAAMQATSQIARMIENGEMDPMDVVKNAKGFETLLNMFEAIEAGAASLASHNSQVVMNGVKGVGRDNRSQTLIFNVIEGNKTRKKDNDSTIIDV